MRAFGACCPCWLWLPCCRLQAFREPFRFNNATATYSQNYLGYYPPSLAIDGVIYTDGGWAIYNPNGMSPQTAVFQTVVDQGLVGGTLFTFNLYQEYYYHSIGDFRLSVTQDDRSSYADGLAVGGNVAANWIVLDPLTAIATNGAILTIEGDGSILASGNDPIDTVYTVTASTTLTGITGFRLETLQNSSLPVGGPGRYWVNGNFVLSEFTVNADPASVPEPGTLSMLGAALLCLGALSRKRLRG